MEEYKVITDFGTVSFGIEQLIGCCGVSVIYDVNFIALPKNKVKLYDYFYNEVIFGEKDLVTDFNHWGDRGLISRDSEDWCVNKFIMSDYIEQIPPCIHDFCAHIRAYYGDLSFNPNSGNHIQVYEISRPKGKYYKHNK